ncbi:LysR substrate-binding domain-containing protein [Streptomyces europaeiscabiei]|nr:LysR substrate-binding domain-containing protein [Streptomyces europaeiscabiei]
MGAAEPGIPPEPDLPDDLRHGHRPPTGTSTQLAIHTRPVTCDFSLHTALWACYHNGDTVDDLSGHLRVFASVTACESLLPDLLTPLRTTHPRVRISLRTGDAASALVLLDQGETDLAVAALPDRIPATLLTRQITHTPLVLIQAAALTAEQAPDLNKPFVLPRQGLVRTAADHWFRSLGIHPHIAAEADGHEALPVELVGRIRGDRVMRLPKPPRVYDPKGGRPPKHGPEFRFTKPETWPAPSVTTVTDTTNYGKAEAQAWDRVHPRLTHRSAWLEHDGELPIVEGTLVRLKVEHLSKEREAPPVWLWSSKTKAIPADVDRWWQGFLRRFDLEHTFRFGKQTLGWTTPKLRTPEAADRWTWLLVVAHTQLRLARPLAADLRRPWEKPTKPERLTPARVRRGFRNIRAHLLCPARVPQPRGAGPGRPPGTKNRHPAPRYDVGKTVKRPETLKAIGRPGRSW